jgi:sugar phosphate isomerase/epimerase
MMDSPTLPCLKGRHPLPLCAPSFLYRAGWASNVERLRFMVDEVELLFLESNESCGLPAQEEISLVASLAAPVGLKLNVHLPLDIDLGSVDPELRARAHGTINRVIALAAPLSVSTFVLHVPRALTEDRAAWRARVSESLALLPEPRSRFAVETLDWDLREAKGFLRDLGFSVCIDIGHLLIAGREVGAFFESFRGSITMVHLHGVQGRKDHLPLSVLAPETRARIGSILEEENYRGSLSLELFSAEHFLSSLPALAEMLAW